MSVRDRMGGKLLFQGLTSEQLEQVSQIVKVRELKVGSVIIDERGYGDTLYMIDKGRVSRYTLV